MTATDSETVIGSISTNIAATTNSETANNSDIATNSTTNEAPTVILTIGMAGSGKTTFMQVSNHFNLPSFSQPSFGSA
jgi:signal recognition particle GTPase